ncbi:hypothetical protein BEWA_031640 [Theileria equi strain WA]|uniref:COG complex component COG2 C-terminal domain-containing protein n=1 Tax=Theileria equi strain WA TaxID=1537102 RepID=L0AZ69_THEEQ|nr:hypothetical protein BEWA_031640 [Theileria equi strain WA]AFZ80311.1 hypothetical protein BEWA_031640 [Theileria equi strain WA]|eukprot:XP_004829977.1 hypothetical protein BEWA_031640 [Theileria equi strain WA]
MDAPTADIYSESLDWIKSVNHQMRSPGAFISSRLETVSLEHVHREFSALLLATQSHSSALIRTVFADASSHDESLKMIIKSLWPVKDRITESCRSFEPIKDEYFLLRNRVENLLKRVAVLSYAKATIMTFMEAHEYFSSVCTEIIDSLNECKDNRPDNNQSSIDEAVKITEYIANNGYKVDGILQGSLVWTLFELVPKELGHVSSLLRKCKSYEQELGMLVDGKGTEWVVTSEATLGWADLGAFKTAFSVAKMEDCIDRLRISLATTIELYSSQLFSRLYKAYSELHNCSEDELTKNGLEEETQRLLSGLTSVIKGYNELRSGDASPLVCNFVTNFLDPFLQSTRLDGVRDDSNVFATLSQELDLFPKFVHYVEENILNEERSLVMRFLNDLSRKCGLETFRTLCIFDALAKAIFDHIYENYSWIFTAVYPEYFFQNYRAFERLLMLIEQRSDDATSHLFKWRGSLLPSSLGQRFCTGMICDNFVDNICTNVFKEFTKYNDIDGNFFISDDKKFYIRSSHVVYDEIRSMFSESKFLHHLFPQYLKGLYDIFWGYIGHMDSFISHMELGGDGGSEHWPSGLSFAYSTYVLHDIVIFRDCFRVSSARNVQKDIATEPGLASEQELGSIAKILLGKAGYPLFFFLKNGSINSSFSEPIDCWFGMAEIETALPNEDLEKLIIFTREIYGLVCTFLNMAYDKVDAMKTKLDKYIITSLYTSSKCSLQFIQSMPSKFRGSNKVEPKGASDYVKFLVAPLSSFKEFSSLVITNQESQDILSKTVARVVVDYIQNIKSLLESVETLNTSISKANNIMLDDQSKDFLIVDTSMIKRQISKDVTEFYDTCQTRFGINASTCPELEDLLEYVTY